MSIIKDNNTNKNKDSPPPLKVGQTIDLTPDSCIKKTLVREGTGFDSPNDGDQVNVQYIGKLIDGSEFINTRKRGVEHLFIVGKEKIVKGIDIAIKTMKKGEIATISMKSKYAYGSIGGHGGLVPPHSSCIFELELVSFTSKSDISPNLDGSLIKTITTHSKSDPSATTIQSPIYESLTKINYVLKYQDTGKIIEEKKDFQFRMGDEENISLILETIVGTMMVGEKCTVLVRYSQFNFPSLNLPANAKVVYQVELLSFTPEKPYTEYKPGEKIENGLKRKDRGSELFKTKKYHQAIKKYKLAVEIFNYTYGLSESDREKCKLYKTQCLVNQGICYLLLNDWSEAVKVSSVVLKDDPNNVKALYCRGKSHNNLFEFDQAKRDLEYLITIEPNNQDAKKELQSVKTRQKENESRDKQLYSKIIENY